MKDAVFAREGGVTHLFASAFFPGDGAHTRCHVVHFTTENFLRWSGPTLVDGGGERGEGGACSPDVVRIGSLWHLTFNSWGDVPGRPNQLYMRSASSLQGLDSARAIPLARNLTQGVRAIDAALVPADLGNGETMLMWKEKQELRIARVRLADGNGVTRPKRPEFGTRETFENAQFVSWRGQWRLLVTRKDSAHDPWVFSQEREGDFTRWNAGSKLTVPKQEFNTGDRANAASVFIENTPRGTRAYLLYAGSTQESRDDFAGRGWNRLGLARSVGVDLLRWEALP